MRQRRCVVIGGGGHSKVVIETLRSEGCYLPVAVTDTRQDRWGTTHYGISVAGDENCLQNLRSNGIAYFIIGIGFICDYRSRKRLYLRINTSGFEPITAIHQSAIVSETAQVGAGTVICPAAVLNPDVRIGQNVIVNTGAIIEHDCVIESHAHICPGVRLAGNVVVEEGGFVGIGAVVKQDVRIGVGALVGAGSVVLKDVPAGAKVVGNPARIYQEISAPFLASRETYNISQNKEVVI